MNFEIIDNVFQVAVFFAAALGDMVYWFYKRDRLYIILALVHSCFMMGTLYFVLHLVIRGVVPQVFYVSEISWIASYLFMHTYQIVRYRIKKIRIAKIPLICGAGVLIASMWSGSSDCFYVERNFWTGIAFYRYFCDGGRGDCFYRCI